MALTMHSELVKIPIEGGYVEGMLVLPDHPVGIVVFAHGSGSSRLSPRNNYVAGALHNARLGTLLMDLLTADEDRDYRRRFDMALLTQRLNAAVDWVQQHDGIASFPVGLFGASTGAAAALQVAAARGAEIAAVVSRGGRPDLAGKDALGNVRAPTLFIVGGLDSEVIMLNEDAYSCLRCEKRMEIIPGATHLFEEPGTLGLAAEFAAEWFARYMVVPV